MLIRGGSYRLSDTVVFSLEDSAPVDGTITYAAYAGESPIFTSLVPIRSWQKASDPSPLLPDAARASIWTADVSNDLANVLTLYDGTKRLRRAWSKSFTPVAYISQSDPPDVLAFPTGAMKNWPDLRNGELRVIPSCDYEMCLIPLASVDEKSGIAKTVLPATRSMGRVKFMDETVWVENILEVLDEPGEWVFSQSERKLYLWPTGDRPSEAIAAPKLTELLRVEGNIDYDGPEDAPVRGLVFEGLTFTGGERLPWHGATKGELQHEWEHSDLPTALVRFRGAQNCAVTGCRFVDTSHAGIRLDLTCIDNRITRNEVAHTGGVGILLDGYGPGTKDANKRNEVSNNWVHHIGEIYWASPGIMVWQSGENKSLTTWFITRRIPESPLAAARAGPARTTLPSAPTKSNCQNTKSCPALRKAQATSTTSGGPPASGTCMAEKMSSPGTTFTTSWKRWATATRSTSPAPAKRTTSIRTIFTTSTATARPAAFAAITISTRPFSMAMCCTRSAVRRLASRPWK